MKLRTEPARNEAEDRIYTRAIGENLVILRSDYGKKSKFEVNLPTMAATKPSFANPEVKAGLNRLDAPGKNTCKKDEDHQANQNYVVSEFLRSTSNNQQQQKQQIVMI